MFDSISQSCEGGGTRGETLQRMSEGDDNKRQRVIAFDRPQDCTGIGHLHDRFVIPASPYRRCIPTSPPGTMMD